LAGGRAKIGRRYPSGRLVPDKGPDDKLRVSRQPHRRDLPPDARPSEKAESPLGRLNLMGIITDEQHDAGVRYAALIGAYRAVIDAPRGTGTRGTGRLGRGFRCGAETCDPEDCECLRREERYESAHAALLKAGRNAVRAVERVALHGEAIATGDLVAIYIGLSALCGHFGLNRREQGPPRLSPDELALFNQELNRDPRRAMLAWKANQVLQVPYRDVDGIADRARALFDVVPAADPAASDRDLVKWALGICEVTAALSGRLDLTIVMTGVLHAVEERYRGLDEPLLQKSPGGDHREPYEIRRVKSISAVAYRTLMRFGMKDAAGEVWKVILKGKYLSSNSEKSTSLKKSLQRWLERRAAPGSLPILPMDGFEHFAHGWRLFGASRADEARQSVLHELKHRLDDLAPCRQSTETGRTS
jgi:hypothetical protein